MTITERIEDSLKRGRLNYREIKEIIKLDTKRRREGSDVDLLADQILSIIENADLSTSQRLEKHNRKS